MQAAQAAIYSDTAQISLQQTRISAAAATLQGDKARLTFAQMNNRRYASLSASGASTVQNSEQANTNLATAQATLDMDKAGLRGAQRQSGGRSRDSSRFAG